MINKIDKSFYTLKHDSEQSWSILLVYKINKELFFLTYPNLILKLLEIIFSKSKKLICIVKKLKNLKYCKNYEYL